MEKIIVTENIEATSAVKEQKLKAYKMLTNDSTAKMKYLIKPAIFIFMGIGFICTGTALTASHFLFEDSTAKNTNSQPYFTYGPIAFASGLIVFTIGLVWFTVKRHKWTRGTASPIAKAMAMAAQVAATATLAQERVPHWLRKHWQVI